MRNIKHFTIIILALVLAFPAIAKKKDKEEDKKDAYVFTAVKDIPTTSIKNQYRSGTCWSFSGLSFLETELIRTGKGKVDLSEMFVVRNAYSQKAINTVRWHGNLNFGGGGAFHDVTWVFENYGAVPEIAYAGLEYGEEKHVHGEMDALLDGYVKTVIENKNKKVSTAWHAGFDGILDAYLGEVPETFEVEGVEYTPKSYAEYLDLDMSDYVEIGSYTHHPFYSSFILEVPDNWMLDEIHNVPMEDMMTIIENAIMNGYSVAWGADVSEKGFSWKNGVAIVPDADKPEIAGMESEKWEKMDAKEKNKMLYSFDEPVSEKTITQEMRQEQYDNYKTTDDHGMLLTGISKDQNGQLFFKVKNSWSEKGSPYVGYFYASKPFVALKTIDVLVHKDAIPQELKDKMGIK
ncbi:MULTISPECIES: aminopeptidase C [unclassified Lentimicrobium]|uniref:aminopeptidase C n=1 Tax=unclassified Lentimicrobium TaxID=2677434 RepID=UPI001553232B|nr:MULTISPECIES: C1 family peptidase [unclassified Lentimicrobium]NPD44200.1 aminopeptidase [Lentimicrobium sp. S6]NPD84658.1 aminopeptidase [Lentimicrobium sp. L6]